MTEDVWIPLVDEPIGDIVARIEDEHPDIRDLVDSPQKLLAFRTFAYIRVGLVLGELLVDADPGEVAEGGTWVERLSADPAVWQKLVAEVRAVADEVSAEAPADPSRPDDAARARFRAFARRALVDE